MSLSAQAKVLRALQESRITRVGGEKEIRVDVRVVAATNKDLRAEISKGKFREDLYHRLAVILIDVPALNDRREDIPQLVEHFVKNICSEYGTPIKKVDATAMELLKGNNWTGNIRELRNVVERLIILSGDQIGKKDVQNYVVNNADNRSKLQSILDQFDSEEKFIEFAREQFEKYKGVPA
jgi:DNA-binding NtrC family response regulator